MTFSTAALALLSSILLLAQAVPPPVRIVPVPDAGPLPPGMISRASAEADPTTFARAVAEAGHPAGFIMPVSERQRPLLPADGGHALSLEAALKTFIERNAAYSAAFSGGTLVVRHRDTPADITTALEAPRTWRASKLPAASALFNVILRTLARQPVAAIDDSGPPASPTCRSDQTVSITAGRASVFDTLNRLAAQSKGVAWLVRFGPAGEKLRLQIGYVCGDGVWSALSVPGW